MRILIINYEFPPIGGGGGTASLQAAARLSEKHAVKVLTSRYADLPSYERIDRFEVHRVPVMRRRQDRSNIFEMMTFILGAMWGGRRLIREWQPDVMAAFFGIPSGVAAWIFHLLTGIPYTISLLGGDVPGFTGIGLELHYRLLKPLIRVIWRKAAGVTANSVGLANLAQQTTPELDIQVIVNGIDTEQFCPAETPPPAPVRVLFIGRLVEHKAPGDLIQAAALLKQKDIAPFVIEFVGDGPLRESLENLSVELAVDDRVEFSGWWPFEQLADKYRSAHVFCLPSLHEGMPYVVVQAMACGLPIVGTDSIGMQELVVDGENGFLIPISTPDQLADRLAAVINDPDLRARMGIKAREYALPYNWDIFAERYEALFRAALEKSQ